MTPYPPRPRRRGFVVVLALAFAATFAFTLTGCKRAAKERLPASGTPAVLFDSPPKGWTRTMTSKKGYSMLAVYSPDMSCGMTVAFVEDPLAAFVSYRKLQEDIVAKSAKLKTGAAEHTGKSGFSGVAFDMSVEKDGGEVNGRVYCFRLDATHAVVFEGFEGSRAPQEERNAVKRFIDGVELVPGPGGTAAQPAPEESLLEKADDAETALDRGDYDGAIRLCDAALAGGTAYANAFYIRSQAWWHKGDRDKCMADLDATIEAAPGFERAYFVRGNLFYGRGDYQHAIADFTEAIRLDPGDSSAYTRRGMCYKLSEGDKAEADFRAALALDPNDAEGHGLLGIVLAQRGDNAKALEEYNKAVSLEPGLEPAHLHRGNLLEKSGKFADAAADYAEAARLKPKDAVAWNYLAWLLATCPDVKVRDGAKAVDAAMKACELSQWEDANAVDTLAAAYAESGDFASAVKFEQWYLALPGVTEEDAKGARERLAGYQNKQAWREKE